MLLRLSLILISFLLFINNAFANVTAVLETGRITIQNQTPKTICFEAHEEHSLTLIEWAPICGEDNRIHSGQRTSIPLNKDQFAPSDFAVVSWWYEENNTILEHLRLNIPQTTTGKSKLPLK